MIIFVVNGLARGILVSLDMLGLAGFATGLGLVLCVGGIVVVASGPVIGELYNKTVLACNRLFAK